MSLGEPTTPQSAIALDAEVAEVAKGGLEGPSFFLGPVGRFDITVELEGNTGFDGAKGSIIRRTRLRIDGGGAKTTV